MHILLQADSSLFLGRFHSLAVHLPIGFIILTAVLFAISKITKNPALLRPLPIMLLLGSLSAFAAVVLGLLLSEEGGYPANSLFWHQWLGITVVLVSFCSWLWVKGLIGKKKDLKETDVKEEESGFNRKNSSWIVLTLVLLISVTGHLGGNLTHGENYLFDYAPDFIQELMGSENSETKIPFVFPEEPDSTLLYEHVLEKVLIQKCASCHDDATRKGGLIITTREGLLEGGENGAVLQAGSAMGSELFKRISMDPASRKFMPPKGAPLSYAETMLLKFWIQEGMPFDLKVTDERIPEELKLILQTDYQLETERKAIYEKVTVEPANEATLEKLRQLGFRVSTLSEENNFIEVVAKDSVSAEKLNALIEVKEQLTWLDLSNSGMKDEWIAELNEFKMLTRLNLNSNSLSDSGIVKLQGLDNLEAILIHSTLITDSGIKNLVSLKNLKRIYVWNTKVSEDAVDSLLKEHPKLQIDRGVTESKEEKETAKSVEK